MSLARPSRRSVLIGAGALGLVVGIGAWRAASRSDRIAGTSDADGAFLHDWIYVGRDGRVTLRTGQSEMGQGVFTGLATLVAEELGCRLDQMTVETGPASSVFANAAVTRGGLIPNNGFAKGPPQGVVEFTVSFVAGYMAEQITGGSSSIVDRFDSARSAGATARALLVQAAARQWGVAASECAVEAGAVVHAASQRRLGFGELAFAAAAETPPPKIALKPRSDWKLIGAANVQRVDLPGKTDGSAKFGIDVRRPGMLFAAVANCPSFGGALAALDDKAALGLPGVVKIVALADAVAAVADSTWRAKRALAALNISWTSGPAAATDSASVTRTLAAAIDKGGSRMESAGDFARAYADAATKLSADYAVPYLAHAPMEPMNCTAEIGPDGVEVWAPTQVQTRAVAAAAKAAGVSADKVRLHTTLLGGGFGRRLDADLVSQAVAIAKAVGKPVQTLWSREEDVQHDFYRPAAHIRAEGGLDLTGKASALRFVVASQSILARWYPLAVMTAPDPLVFEGLVGLAYAIPNRRTELAVVDLPVPVGNWRAVGHSLTAFAKESFIDEMAHAAGADPLAFRLGLLADQPRTAALLQLAADKAGWGKPMAPGRGRGLALHASFESAVAEVVEVSVGPKGELKVERVVAAVDCGAIVNPDVVRAQVEGAIIYGLSAALFGKITLTAGKVEQGNFDDYEVVKMDQAPRIEVHLTPSDAPPGGIGEPGLPPLAPALANAIFAATGKRVRALPLTDQGFSA